MKFGPVLVEQAAGKILGHNVSAVDGRRALRKGRQLDADDLTLLREAGRNTVYVAELEEGDVPEDASALRIASAVRGHGLRLSGPAAGRVNLRSDWLGVLRVDVSGLDALNELEGITLATLPSHSTVRPNQIAGTVKVIPFALSGDLVRRAEELAGDQGPLLLVDKLEPRKVGLVLLASAGTRERIETQFAPLKERIEALGSELARIEYVDPGVDAAERELATALENQAAAGLDLIVLAGESAIMDRADLAPRAAERIGGRVECVGAPVDPGNLLMLAYLDQVPVLGAPGCARSRKLNIVDWVLPRLLVGERLTRSDIVAMGHGGLLDDQPER
ncbi:MAG: molybdopterin-binding protein, partial [Anaerolineales bacterium]